MMRLRALLAAVVLLAVACGSPPGPSKSQSSVPTGLSAPVTIEYWYPYGSTVGQAIEAAVGRFNQENAGRITVKPVFQGTFDQQLAKIRAAAAGGGLPQVAAVRDSDVTQFDQAGVVVPLDDYVRDPHHGVSSQQQSDFFPGVLARTRLPVYRNRTLAWPFGNTAASWYYNLDLMQRAGIQQPPTTWDEVLSDARAIKASTGQPAYLLRQDQAGPIFIDTLWTYGVPWLKADGRSTSFDNSAALKVLKMFRQMVDEGSMVVSATAENDFPNGRGAMLWASSGNLVKYSQQITAFKWGIQVPPHGPGARPITEMFGSVHTMFKGTSDQQLASWIFMSYMASSAAQSQFAADTGYFPSEKSCERSPAIQAAYQKTAQYKDAVEKISPVMQLLPQSPALDQVRNRIATDVVTALLLKRISPEEAARKLKTEADQAVKDASS